MSQLIEYKKSRHDMCSSFASKRSSDRHIDRPVGVFWDIENCSVPSGKSVIKLVANIRQFIIESDLRESQFLVVCDTLKTNKELLDDLNSSQVTVIHVSSSAKNAADDKLKQEISRFVQIHGCQSALLVLTDDINFACVLSDLRNRERVIVILFHRQASPALLTCADIIVDFTNFCKELPSRFEFKTGDPILLVRNLPTDKKRTEIRKRLHQLSFNCGGKVFFGNSDNTEAIIKFGCFEDAKRSQPRIDCQDVFGNKIVANLMNKESKELTDSSRHTTSNSESEDNSNTTDSSITNKRIIMSNIKQRSHRNTAQDMKMNEMMPYCIVHSKPVSENAWIEYLCSSKPLLPMVNISLSDLATRVHHLVDSHGGALPLHSFVDCYVEEFHETFNTRDSPLISLEHLITCVPGVSITISPNNHIKRITWLPNTDKDMLNGSIHSEQTTSDIEMMTNKVSHFAKEVRELLKSQTHSIIAFNKFVPAYHTHFVRQLCVSSFGFLKLSELLEEIPHVVHIYGENEGRMITLTHREQTKRFATDLIKVLKAQTGRKLKLTQFSSAYQVVFNKNFDICDYGVCYIEDILKDVWEGTVVIKPFGTNDKWIEIPKRERNNEQIKRTNYFGKEVVQLLSTISNFELTFSKFIPSYHHYYNKQCRVLDFGFTKLIELLEELSPDFIDLEYEEEYGERVIRLNAEKRLQELCYRLELLLKGLQSRSASVSELERLYKRKYGTTINYIDYYANDFIDLIDKMPINRLQITKTRSSTYVNLIDKHHSLESAHKAVRILMSQPKAEMKISELEERYSKEYRGSLSTILLKGQEFKEMFEFCINTNLVKLSPMFAFARDCIQLMQSNNKEKYTLDDLETGLMEMFNRPLPQPYNYKCTSFSELFRKLSHYFVIDKKGKPGKFILLISLNKYFKKCPLVVNTPQIRILKREVEPETETKPKEKDNCDLHIIQNNNTVIEVITKEKHENDLLDSDVPEELPPPKLMPSREIFHDLIRWSPEVADDLMEFDCTEDTIELEESYQNSCVSVGKLEPIINGFKQTNGFCKKTRILANFS